METYPGVVTSVVGGSSYEGQEIKGVKVSFKAGNPVVIFEGGVSSYPTTYFAFLLRNAGGITRKITHVRQAPVCQVDSRYKLVLCEK